MYIPATLPRSRVVASDIFRSGLIYASPFVLANEMTLTALAMRVRSHFDLLGNVALAIFAASAFPCRPSGSALASATSKLQHPGIVSCELAVPVTLPAGTYFSAARTNWMGQRPQFEAVENVDLAMAAAIGANDLMNPPSGLQIPATVFDDLATIILTGTEAWEEINGPAGAPVVWLQS